MLLDGPVRTQAAVLVVSIEMIRKSRGGTRRDKRGEGRIWVR